MAHTRPFMITGVALASAAAIAAGPSIVMAGSPTPVALSTAKYQLTALADVTIEGITGALLDGWGGFIGPDDVFYPGTFNNDVKLTGGTGLAYYLADQALEGIAPYNVENYFFEVGSRSASNSVLAGLGAVAYVGVGSTFGIDSVPAQLVKAITTGSFDLGNINIGDVLGGIDLTNLVPTVLALAANIPVIGPLASVYLTGQVPGDETMYGTGLAGVVAYAQTALPGISDLINAIGAGGKDKADDESESDDASEDATEDETEDEGEDEGDDSDESGKSHGKVKSAASLMSEVAVADVADVAPAVSAPATETADVETDVKAGIQVDNTDNGTDVGPASRPASSKRGLHRAGDSAKVPANAPEKASAHVSKRTASRSSRGN
ncbi:MAG: hypothetical protein KIH64_005780 [Mycobacterium sp.]|nr:hypothetical protein [Mycobacterium sp.]